MFIEVHFLLVEHKLIDMTLYPMISCVKLTHLLIFLRVKNGSFQIVEFDYSTNEGQKSPCGLKLTGLWIAEYPQEVCHRNKLILFL